MNLQIQNPKVPEQKLYTIGTVSKLTGVGAITLRAWERRYGLIHPVRKDSGHRLFTRENIDQINRITALTAHGMRISQITPEMLTGDPGEKSSDKTAGEDHWSVYLQNMVSAIIAFDETRLEELYTEVLSLYPIDLVTSKLLRPLLVELGLRWETGTGKVAEEHFFAFYLRNKLGARFHHRRRHERGKLLLLAGLPGEYHEIALLLFALVANEHGYRLLTLGADMPLSELPYVALKKKCDAIVLSGAIEPDHALLTKRLPELVSQVSMPVFIGGQASVMACDAINRTGAVALGHDMEQGLIRLSEQLE